MQITCPKCGNEQIVTVTKPVSPDSYVQVICDCGHTFYHKIPETE